MSYAYESMFDFLGAGIGDKSVLSLPHVNSAIGSVCGPYRDENQDRAIIMRSSLISDPTNTFLLFAISDGIGGLSAGGTCARATLSALSEFILQSKQQNTERLLTDAIQKTNAKIFEKFSGKSGATLSLFLISKKDKRIYIGNVGDSRVYSYCKSSDSRVEQLTTDDTFEARLAEMNPKLNGDIAPELKGRLTQYIGMQEDADVSIYSIDYYPEYESGYVLTTDGVHNMAQPTFNNLILNASSAKEMAERLLDVAIWSGSKDNATVVTVSADTVNRFMSTKKQSSRLASIWSPYRQLDIALVENGLVVNPKVSSPAEEEKPKRGRPKNKQPIPKRATAKKKIDEKKASEKDTADMFEEQEQPDEVISIKYIKE